MLLNALKANFGKGILLQADWWRNIDVVWQGKKYSNILDLPYTGLIPFHILKQLLAPISCQSFVDLLNEPSTSSLHIITVYEEMFRKHEREEPNTPYFSKSVIFEKCLPVTTEIYIELDHGEIYPFLIEIEDFLAWSKRNHDFISELKSLNFTHQGINSKLIEFEAENERLKARIAELENSPKIIKRSMWKYVLDLESRGMSDEDIRNALTGDGFSGAQADALLYDGEGTTKDAVKKWGEKFKKGE